MNKQKSLKTAFVFLFLFSLILGGMYLFSKKEKDIGSVTDQEIISDSVKFSKEYTQVGEENIFEYKTIDEIVKIFEGGTGVVYLGFPECPWCQRYVVYLNEVARENGIETIYYTNILKDRKDNTEGYQKLVSLLDGLLLNDNEGNPRIFVPDISVVVNGEIVGHDNETSVVTEEDGTPDEYWTEEKVGKLKLRLKGLFEKLGTGSCTSCEV